MPSSVALPTYTVGHLICVDGLRPSGSDLFHVSVLMKFSHLEPDRDFGLAHEYLECVLRAGDSQGAQVCQVPLLYIAHAVGTSEMPPMPFSGLPNCSE